MTSSSDISKSKSQVEGEGQPENENRPEGEGQPKKRPPRFILCPVITPLPSQAKAAGGTGEFANSGNAKGEAADADASRRVGITGEAPAVAGAASRPGAPKNAGPKSGAPVAILRGENEDDDGYDPYSDYHDGTARTLQFERDPWN
jgi:hypothetical protein